MPTSIRHRMPLRSLVLAAGLTLACGDGELVAVDVAHQRDGTGRALLVASAIHVDAEGAAWQATHAAGLSASFAPDDRMARAICEVVDGGTRGSDFAAFRALDLGNVTLEQEGGSSLALAREDVRRGEGSGFRGEFDVVDIPYEAGTHYIVRATGSGESPAFGARIRAPADFNVERIGRVTPGAGTVTVPRRGDLDILWSPSGSDGEVFIALETPTHGLICRVPDDGRFTIKGRYLRDMPPSNGQLVVERYYEADFETTNAGDGRTRNGRIRFSVQRVHRIALQ
jgi:hypothetical protein